MKSPCLFSKTKGIRVVWGITSKCNLKCKHCAAEFGKEFITSKNAYSKILREMSNSEVDTIYLSGGEPLLLDKIFDIIKIGGEYGIKMTIGTNGVLLDKEKARKLSNVGIDKVFVSLDHYQKDKHNFLRGDGVFDNVIRAIKYLKKYEIYTRVDCVIWKENYESIEKFVDFCLKLNVDEITFAWVINVRRATKYDIFPPKHTYFEIGKKLKELKEKYSDNLKISYHRFEYFNNNCRDCQGGRKIFYITPNGKLSPCFWITTLFPQFTTEKTIFENNFSNLLKEEPIKKFLKMEKERYMKFGPGCPAVSTLENGNFYSKDPLLK